MDIWYYIIEIISVRIPCVQLRLAPGTEKRSGMRSLKEQKKTVLPVIIAILGIGVYAFVALVLLGCMMPDKLTFMAKMTEMMMPTYETLPIAAVYAILIVGAVVLIVVPVIFVILGFRRRYWYPSRAEGLNLDDLNEEQYHIYVALHDFLRKGGFKILPGYDCDNLYIGKVLFGNITLTRKVLYVNINKDFSRYDGRIDRSGYIAIPHAPDLPRAKERIYSMYKEYFRKFRKRR